MLDLTSPSYIREFLVSDLWRVLILRAGVKAFLKSFLPVLMTYLVCSNFKEILPEALNDEIGADVVN